MKKYARLSVLADRLSGLFVLLLMAFTAALVVPLEPWVRLPALGAGAAAGLGLVFFLLVPRSRMGRAESGKVRQVAVLLALYRGSPRLVFAATVLSALVQVANVVLLWMLGQAAGLPLPLSYCFVLMPLVCLL